MSSPLLALHLPGTPDRRLTLPYVPPPRPATSRKLPNGTIIVTDEASPSLLYKLSPWKNASLAFNEADVYSWIYAAADPPGIVELVGVSGTQEHFIRVLRRSHAGSLNRFLFDRTRGDHRLMETAFARSLLARIARAMADIHALDIVHRDLKAENVLVFDTGADPAGDVLPQVADFDRAARLPDGEFLHEPVGSLYHMAPELLAWQPYDRRVDIYAFGILMFEVAHGGSRPHSHVATGMPGSITSKEFADQVVNQAFRPVWAHGDDALKTIASRCWAANPDDRPQFREIAEWLQSEPGERAPFAWSPSAQRARLAPADIDGVGIACDVGRVRPTMEDAACVLKTDDALIACVFDGLRGARASAFAARQLAMALLDALAREGGDDEAAVRDAFKALNAVLRSIEPAIECGSTAVVAVVRDDDLLVAWIGDSPAFLFRKSGSGPGFSATPIVDRHHPGRDDEAARIAGHGGVVRREQRLLDSGEIAAWGPLRVFVPAVDPNAGIAVSRTVGLFPFRPAIGDEPEIFRLPRHDDDLFLVLGSDGVFDVLDAEKVHQIIRAAPSAQQAADAVIDAVLRNGAPDNASVVVINVERPSGC